MEEVVLERDVWASPLKLLLHYRLHNNRTYWMDGIIQCLSKTMLFVHETVKPAPRLVFLVTAMFNWQHWTDAAKKCKSQLDWKKITIKTIFLTQFII